MLFYDIIFYLRCLNNSYAIHLARSWFLQWTGNLRYMFVKVQNLYDTLVGDVLNVLEDNIWNPFIMAKVVCIYSIINSCVEFIAFDYFCAATISLKMNQGVFFTLTKVSDTTWNWIILRIPFSYQKSIQCTTQIFSLLDL